MNFRVDVQSLRWLLVAVNLSCLVLMGGAVYAFFLGEPDELRVQLADAQAFRLKADNGERTSNETARKIRNDLYRKPPPPKPVAKQPDEKKQEYRVGGPLDAYQILSIAVMDTSGLPMVFLGEKQAETTAAAPRTTRRGRTRRTGSGSTRRTGGARGARPLAVSQNKGLTEGQEFKGCNIVKILVDHVIYSQGDNFYKLLKEPRESALDDQDGGGYVLNPIPDEQAVSAPAIDPAEMGDIKTKGGSSRAQKPDPKARGRDLKTQQKNLEALRKKAAKDPKAQRALDAIEKAKAAQAEKRGNDQ